MKAAAVRWGGLLAIVWSVAVPALSDDNNGSETAITDRDRVFRNYVREAAIVASSLRSVSSVPGRSALGTRYLRLRWPSSATRSSIASRRAELK